MIFPTFKVFLSKIFVLLFLSTVFTGCENEVKDDFNDVSIDLVDQNGDPFNFPADLKGQPVLMGFVYINCPDICSFITANLYKVYSEMGEPEDIHFIVATFDPERDTPEELKHYASMFNMDQPPFRFLTGSPDQVDALMERVGVRTDVSYTKETDDGEELYFMNHSDKILLIDQNAQLIFDYGGSMTPTNILIEDLEKL